MKKLAVKKSNAQITKEPAKKEENQTKKPTQEFSIRASHLRLAPRKVRLVANLIKGLSLDEADDQLTFNHKRPAVYLRKLIKSAKAAASHNYNLTDDGLYIKNILVNEGPTLHRFKPAAHGTAHPIRKRSTHLVMIIAKKENFQEESKIKKMLPKLIAKKQINNKTKAK